MSLHIIIIFTIITIISFIINIIINFIIIIIIAIASHVQIEAMHHNYTIGFRGFMVRKMHNHAQSDWGYDGEYELV